MRRPAFQPSAASAPIPATDCTTRIQRLGAEGDGIGATPDGATLYVPRTLPGELVRVTAIARRGEDWSGVPAEISEASPARAIPPCPHFGQCGGCAMQHLRDQAYIDWKSALLTHALRRAGDDATLPAPAARTPPGARRRMDLALRRAHASVLVGLHRARGAEVVDLQTCLVLHPALVALVAPLRRLLAGLQGFRREGSAVANLLDSGPDLLLRMDGEPSTGDRTRMVAFAVAHGLPRLHWAHAGQTPELICQHRPAATGLAGVTVLPPPGGFLQASAEGEAAITAAVLAGLPAAPGSKSRIGELYAGSGTLTLALARHARVAAWEGDALALAALRRAAADAGLSGRIVAERRDLARQPIPAKELAGFAALVLDPPHAGATAQVATIAASGVKRVIYVSCNPTSLGRDLRVLRAAGYRVASATPIDQFLWSARLESVVVLQR